MLDVCSELMWLVAQEYFITWRNNRIQGQPEARHLLLTK